MKAVKLEQIMLQQRAKIQWLKGGDQCTRIFFRKVASRRASKQIFQITDDDGQTPTTPREIIGEVVGFYRRLLGGEPSTWFFNLLYLRPWANHIVTVEKAQRLLRPVTKEDIKLVIFDIAEYKSLGPDGYSSSFYKAAWPVIGEEVTKAIMEFFSTGLLLRQLNATLLALIPKGASGDRYPKVAWNQVCQLIEEGGQGIRDILVVNLALMSRHLWRITQGNSDSIWVNWIYHVQLQGKSIWTVNDRTGSCGWRKLLQLLQVLHPWVVYQVGMVSPSYSGMILGIALDHLFYNFQGDRSLLTPGGRQSCRK
ncbi:UNVERIFIED_CONTAM: hypothetical protein Sradi_5062500 [Sesamum radiatum]|uniref:Reverse transcriptase n=1 Tax=Sesamum radiatum TaxID=300843 RepID=A0AAW2M046_SESRA